MRILIVFAALVCCAVSQARADGYGSLKDGPLAATPGRCIGGAFAGPYAGVQIGFGSLNSKASGEAGSISDNDGGFTVGGHSGYNVQCGRVLFGVESDISYFGTDIDSECGLCGQTFKSETNWYGTLRARVGLVRNENFLLFATAGLAYADVDHAFSDPLAPGGPFSQANDNMEFGWTAGGGIEFMRDSHWSLRADALYVDLGSEGHLYTADPSACGGPCTTHVNWDDNFWVARLGLTYHFTEQATTYTPLK